MRSWVEQRPEWVENRPSRGLRALDLRELWQYRELGGFLALRDLKVRYKQAAFGVAWALLQPLAFLAIFAVFFGRVAKIGGDGVPYAAFALTALIPWNYIATTVSFGSSALLNDASLVRTVATPMARLTRTTLPPAALTA
jgi:ABC-type polysaccharide/polyol phosphate export permease